MNDSNYTNYSDLIKALKEKKKSLRNQILHSVAEAIKEIEKRLKK